MYDYDKKDDEDGDGDSGPCEAPADHITCDDFGSNPTWAQVLGLDCPGTANNSIQTLSDSLTNSNASALAFGTAFGTSGDWVPTEGEQAMLISTGPMPAPDAMGVLVMADGEPQGGTLPDANNNPDSQPLPAPMSATPGWPGTPQELCAVCMASLRQCSMLLLQGVSAGGGSGEAAAGTEWDAGCPHGELPVWSASGGSGEADVGSGWAGG